MFNCFYCFSATIKEKKLPFTPEFITIGGLSPICLRMIYEKQFSSLFSSKQIRLSFETVTLCRLKDLYNTLYFMTFEGA